MDFFWNVFFTLLFGSFIFDGENTGNIIDGTDLGPWSKNYTFINNNLSVSLDIYIDESLSNRDKFYVFINLEDYDNNHWLGLYCPAGKKYDKYTDWFNISSNYFVVYQTSVYCNFLLWENIGNVNYLRGYSEIFRRNITNQYPRLGYSNDGVFVTWISTSKTPQMIRYGSSFANISKSGMSEVSILTNKDFCAEPANDNGYIDYNFRHTVDFKEDTVAFIFEKQNYFYTTDSEKKVVIYGDMGLYNTSRQVVSRLLTDDNYNMIIHVGDISYATGHAYLWRKWFSQMKYINVPYLIAIGNHEYDYEKSKFLPGKANYWSDSHGECGIPSKFYYNLTSYWYSINHNDIHFIFMSTEHNFTKGSEQYNWIINDLQTSTKKWNVLLGHRPMYNSNKYSKERIFSEYFRENMESIISKVDICFWGHYHSYERTCAVFNGTCGKGPVHITVGTGGANIDNVKNYAQKWSVKRIQDYGYGKLSLYNHDTLVWIFNGLSGTNDTLIINK